MELIHALRKQALGRKVITVTESRYYNHTRVILIKVLQFLEKSRILRCFIRKPKQRRLDVRI